MSDIGFLNGRFMPLEQAMIPVEDRGFQFGDGVYEVLRTYRGVPYQLEAHLARLERSAQAIGLSMPYRVPEWREFVKEGIRLGGHDESKVYIQVTRGVAPRDHAFPAAASSTVVMTIRAMKPLSQVLRETGVGVIMMEDLRWGRCDIKSVNLLPNVMAKQRAQEAGAFEAIFVRDGLVTEGAVSNVMVVRGGVLATAPEGERILSGVTRSVVLALARQEGVTVQEQAVSLEELRRADEVFLTGTTVEILAVVRLGGAPIGTGRPGELTGLLSARFRASLG
ncbi:MAG: D-amino-acid transaminase [Nitrospirae bacterium]|nr:MAG: D-amino-acid transaminase [Nitrospirota bacterium]